MSLRRLHVATLLAVFASDSTASLRDLYITFTRCSSELHSWQIELRTWHFRNLWLLASGWRTHVLLFLSFQVMMVSTPLVECLISCLSLLILSLKSCFAWSVMGHYSAVRSMHWFQNYDDVCGIQLGCDGALVSDSFKFYRRYCWGRPQGNRNGINSAVKEEWKTLSHLKMKHLLC